MPDFVKSLHLIIKLGNFDFANRLAESSSKNHNS